MTIKTKWCSTTDFGYQYYFYLGEIKVGHISRLAHEPGGPKWSAGTGLPIPYHPHIPFLGHFHSLDHAKAAVEGAVDHFLIMTGLRETFR